MKMYSTSAPWVLNYRCDIYTPARPGRKPINLKQLNIFHRKKEEILNKSFLPFAIYIKKSCLSLSH